MTELTLREEILDISRQNKIGQLSPWFSNQLDIQIKKEWFVKADDLRSDVLDPIVTRLTTYRTAAGVDTVVLGVSGGVDSALTATLFKRAGWKVIGYALPINQDPKETERGVEACKALGIEYHIIDLSKLYEAALEEIGEFDSGLLNNNSKAEKIRHGNIRARLRMITLYNMASARGGLVASTDNFSELGAGFWTIHGDVGDVSPIQGLNKSWEVPMLSKLVGVPEATWRATPTDGLGIDDGDEAQLGCSYLEWDLAVNYLMQAGASAKLCELSHDAHAFAVIGKILQRMRGSWFKRMNPYTFEHPTDKNLKALREFEEAMNIIPAELQDA